MIFLFPASHVILLNIPGGRKDPAVTDDAKESDVVYADAVLDPAIAGWHAGNLTPSHGGGARNAGSRRVVIELPETHFVNEC